jgi:hypothetical protein
MIPRNTRLTFTFADTFCGPNGDFGIQTMEELGFPAVTTSVLGTLPVG